MKNLLIILIACLTASAVFAGPGKKASLRSHVSLGPVVALGHSWIHDANLSDNKFKFAPAAGIGLVYSTEEHWGFGVQLLASHEGFKRQYSNSTGTGFITVNPVYLRLPLHAIYFFGKYGDRVRPKIYAGPSLAFKVDEQQHYSSDLLKPAGTTTDLFRSFDFGLTAGIGANVRISRATWLNLDAGYYHGLLDATKDYGYKNRNLRLSLGLMWGL